MKSENRLHEKRKAETISYRPAFLFVHYRGVYIIFLITNLVLAL
jgi:hypothetical protein